MPINLSLRELRAFVALAEERSFTRAATRVHLSQPAFSTLIRALEGQLQARLFDRTTRSVEPTAEGLALLEPARHLLQDAEAAVADVRDHAARRRGRVAVAVLPSLAAGWLPELLARFRAQHPGIELDVADVLSDECVERLEQGRADLALASTRSASPLLHAEQLCRDRFHVVCRHDHPLATGRGAVALNVLARWPIVQLARSSSVRQVLDAAVYPLRLPAVMELQQLASVAGMVAAGLGVAVVPALTLFHFRRADLVTRPLGKGAPMRELFVLRRADRALSSAAEALHARVLAERARLRRLVSG